MTIETHISEAYGLLHSEKRILVGPASWLGRQEGVEVKSRDEMRELYREEALWMYYAPAQSIPGIVPPGSAYVLTHDGRLRNPARADPYHVKHVNR